MEGTRGQLRDAEQANCSLMKLRSAKGSVEVREVVRVLSGQCRLLKKASQGVTSDWGCRGSAEGLDAKRCFLGLVYISSSGRGFSDSKSRGRPTLTLTAEIVSVFSFT